MTEIQHAAGQRHSSEEVDPIRLLAFYLPQFHPTPENDEWWGPGFTEWSNVVKARTLFPGHRPRRLPAELGFYDLRLPEVRKMQSDLALANGVSGFVYWHYWFEGRRMLERPFEEVLNSKEPDVPFAIGWANASWTGIWTGQPRKTLIEQRYSKSDHERHANYLINAFSDDRYIKIEGRPLVYLFKPLDIPDPEEAMDIWRTAASRNGFPDLFVVGESSSPDQDAEIRKFCDQSAPLYWGKIFGRTEYLGKFGSPFPHITRMSSLEDGLPCGAPAPQREAPVVLAGWDNTPRRGRKGAVLVGDLERFLETQLQSAYRRARQAESPLIFLKSWNEWAEGNILEPCAQYDRRLLECVSRVSAEQRGIDSSN